MEKEIFTFEKSPSESSLPVGRQGRDRRGVWGGIPPRPSGNLSEVVVGVFLKMGSDFFQQTPHKNPDARKYRDLINN
ncbi:MAG: hypothetical protein AAB491_03055 [Patescibacteria group bacterium]